MKIQYIIASAVSVLVLGTVVLMGFAPDVNDVNEEANDNEEVGENSNDSEIFEDLIYGLQDELSERKSDGVERTKDGIKASIHGPTILKVGETALYSIELRNETPTFRPEAPFDFRRESRELLTSGPITLGEELRGPGKEEVRIYSHDKHGATHTLVDVTCNAAGPASITFNSKGQSDITTPTSSFSITVDFSLTCVDEYEGENSSTESEDSGAHTVGVEATGEEINTTKEETTSDSTGDDTQYTEIKTPPFEAGANATPQFAVVYTYDKLPYAQGQFQFSDPHDGCPFYHAHSNVTVYPFEEWYVRGGDGTLHTGGNVSLRDPEPYNCGFGRNVMLSPKSVLVPPAHFLYMCGFFELEDIVPVSELDGRKTLELTNLCKYLSGG